MYMSILANGTNFRRQRYGDFHIPTIPFLCHSIYHKYGISQKNVQNQLLEASFTTNPARVWVNINYSFLSE